MSAVRDDQDEHESNMRRLGLDRVPGFKNIEVYSWQAGVVKDLCSEKGVVHTTASAITALIREKHARAAAEEIRTYFAELEQYEKLKAKFS